MHRGYWRENQNERNHWGDQDVDGFVEFAILTAVVMKSYNAM
jgi:hypothetical protein